MYRYYCIMRPPMIGGLPHGAILQDAECFAERLYVPEIERMAWGWVEYNEPLSPAEIADYELTAAPREDE